MNQETACNLDIKNTVQKKFRANFELFGKIEINGPNAHPVFRYLRRNSSLYDPSKQKAKQIAWNFAKFIVDANGKVVSYIEPENYAKVYRPMLDQLLQ